jgi:hypothetical protein
MGDGDVVDGVPLLVRQGNSGGKAAGQIRAIARFRSQRLSFCPCYQGWSRSQRRARPLANILNPDGVLSLLLRRQLEL